VLGQENNFKQPGERYRSFDPARKERFVKRLSEVVGDARCTKVPPPLSMFHHRSYGMWKSIECRSSCNTRLTYGRATFWPCVACGFPSIRL